MLTQFLLLKRFSFKKLGKKYMFDLILQDIENGLISCVYNYSYSCFLEFAYSNIMYHKFINHT